ncbi:MAG TPA: translation initiation factor IF-6 [Methanolinea sp.]|nr:translation initiation factor IF-6 [Methanolinea sp.]
MDRTISIAGDSNIGVFTRVIGGLAVVPPVAPAEFQEAIIELLDVEIIPTTIQGSEIVGSLLAGNRRGFVVSGLAHDREIALLEEYGQVYLLEHTMNAAGNVIMANDSFAAVHPDMPREMAGEVGEFLGVRVFPLTLGGIKTVGMAGVATNKGVLVHPRSSRAEIQVLEQAAGVPIGTGSVNRGVGLVGTGLLVNGHGYATGLETTGFELGRVEDVFGFLE